MTPAFQLTLSAQAMSAASILIGQQMRLADVMIDQGVAMRRALFSPYFETRKRAKRVAPVAKVAAVVTEIAEAAKSAAKPKAAPRKAAKPKAAAKKVKAAPKTVATVAKSVTSAPVPTPTPAPAPSKPVLAAVPAPEPKAPAKPAARKKPVTVADAPWDGGAKTAKS